MMDTTSEKEKLRMAIDEAHTAVLDQPHSARAVKARAHAIEAFDEHFAAHAALLARNEELEARTAVPDGWALVPVEPTVEMMDQAFDDISLSAAHTTYGVTQHVWDYMLAHAPKPPISGELDAPSPPPQPVLETAAKVEFLKHATVSMASDLGAIGHALGLGPTETGAEPILAAIDALRTAAPFPSYADLDAIDRAMQHMGDALNEIDGCEADDEEATAPGFAAIERLLAATPTAQPVAKITPALRRALKEWGRAPEGDEDADAALLEAIGGVPVLAAVGPAIDTDDIVSVIMADERKVKIIFQSQAARDKFLSQMHALMFDTPPASHITGAK